MTLCPCAGACGAKGVTMVKQIVSDTFFLSQPCEEATDDDTQVMIDLADTLKANSERCVGLAANMIGARKRIIALYAGPLLMVMVNPVMHKSSGSYESEEGCLSLSGTRKVTRYRTIELEYYDMGFKHYRQTFSGWTAQIIQHELDHCNGILV